MQEVLHFLVYSSLLPQKDDCEPLNPFYSSGLGGDLQFLKTDIRIYGPLIFDKSPKDHLLMYDTYIKCPEEVSL